MPLWSPGDTVVLRYFERERVTGVLPARAIGDADHPVLWVAPGTPARWPGIDGVHIRDVPLDRRFRRPWSSVAHVWSGEGVVIVGRPGRAHSLWLFRRDGRFAGWYVQLEAPWREARHGFDTEDHTLDVWIRSDGSWEWKDEDELAVALEAGFWTEDEASGFRAEGERVLQEWPFPTGWEDWRPVPSWPLPELPPDWDS